MKIQASNEFQKSILNAIKNVKNVNDNITRSQMIQEAVNNREVIVSASGALATWTPPESTGRSPQDTVMVRRPQSEKNIDWDSPNNLPISEETFDMLFNDALTILGQKEKLYITDRVIGADSRYALPVKLITSNALTALFSDNMFRPVPQDIAKSVFADRTFFLVTLPYNKLDSKKYEGRLRKLPNGNTSNLIVAVDYDRRLGIIIGSAYLGSAKKLMFTVMNYYLPFEKVLPLHCSANEGKEGDCALMLGLSGTGKTTLSADPTRALLGDDEHGWSEHGIFNFEYGCYAKMININPAKEPDIYDAIMHKDDYLNHGAIVENAMIYPNGIFDYNDGRLTENSRASFPLTYLKNIKPSSVSGIPKTILFLTADASGILPPIAKLTIDQARFWFLMGYTSKLAGTETGIVEPQATFSRFFGQPFMPLNPNIYLNMLGEKLEYFNTNVFLINTGWSGGPYGVGKRIDINITRTMLNAALNGLLNNVEYTTDNLFHINIPQSCPGVPSDILNPINTWNNKEAYKQAAIKLAQKFSDTFDKQFGNKNIDSKIVSQCPGK